MLSRSLSALHVKKAFQDWSETLPLNRAAVKREISEKSMAAEGSSGVCPSSGAASTAYAHAPIFLISPLPSNIAVPEDGHTPLTLSPPLLDRTCRQSGGYPVCGPWPKRGTSAMRARCSGIAPGLLRCCEPVVPLGIRCTSLVHPLYNRCTWLLHHLGLRVCFGRCLKPSAPRLAPSKPATARTSLTLSHRTQRCH